MGIKYYCGLCGGYHESITGGCPSPSKAKNVQDPGASEALAYARKYLADYKERQDHAMEYWAYEKDAYLMAKFIVTGRWEGQT